MHKIRPPSVPFFFICTSRKKTDLARSLGMKNMGELKLHWENWYSWTQMHIYRWGHMPSYQGSLAKEISPLSLWTIIHTTVIHKYIQRWGISFIKKDWKNLFEDQRSDLVIMRQIVGFGVEPAWQASALTKCKYKYKYKYKYKCKYIQKRPKQYKSEGLSFFIKYKRS